MKQFYLAEIVTKDKFIHQGLFFRPKNPGKKAILWVHGLASTFYSNVRLLTEFARQCEKLGIGFASFNTRGHDIVTGIKKVDSSSNKGYTRVGGGAGVEIFAESLNDIQAGVEFLHAQGFSKIIISGHSTGANKTCYFATKENNPLVSGFVLVSPVGHTDDTRENLAKIDKNIQTMKAYIRKGKGNDVILNLYDFPLTPKRYLSLFERDSIEDMFDYGGTGKKLKAYLAQIYKPLFVVFGSNDEYLNISVRDVLKVFDQYAVTKNYKSFSVRGGYHSFYGKEKEVASAILEWTRRV